MRWGACSIPPAFLAALVREGTEGAGGKDEKGSKWKGKGIGRGKGGEKGRREEKRERGGKGAEGKGEEKVVIPLIFQNVVAPLYCRQNAAYVYDS